MMAKPGGVNLNGPTAASEISDTLISVSSMQQLVEARKPEDDWTGLGDAAARRKRQNRLNQRAHRRRKINGSVEPNGLAASRNAHGTLVPVADAEKISKTTSSKFWLEQYTQRLLVTHSESSSPMSHFYLRPSRPGLAASPSANNHPFPLCPDHLITVIQWNVCRAIISLVCILDLDTLLLATGGDMDAWPPPARSVPTTTVPSSLQPTLLQIAVPHDIMIDIFPCARLRDNLICAIGTYDVDELCIDLVGELCGCGYSGDHTTGNCSCSGGTYVLDERKGFVVWSDPWCVSSWEITEGFARKWGWALKGCRELIEASNHWRAQRDEGPLVLEIET